jgi:predicted Zn-dependent peptidase
MGGQLNAYTSRENTSYTLTVFKKDVEKALEILGDMLLNSKYLSNELEIERETILRELLETQKD